MQRKIIVIDEELCTGCGVCIPNCPEGALQVIDEKARLISDLFCDGLGACVGECPEGAMSVIERDAEPYDERRVMANIVKAGPNTIKAHLDHLKNHGEMKLYNIANEYLKENSISIPTTPAKETHGCADSSEMAGCPGSLSRSLKLEPETEATPGEVSRQRSYLTNWPTQLKLVPVSAPYFDGADLLIAADCTGMAYPNFQSDFVKGRILVQGCPKLDDQNYYVEKLAEIFKQNNINSIKVAIMEVPCCMGLVQIVNLALKQSGKSIPIERQVIQISGQLKGPSF
jgi:NAD-dependent dihydropyrimidine dehydrogenase PreA subunit